MLSKHHLLASRTDITINAYQHKDIDCECYLTWGVFEGGLDDEYLRVEERDFEEAKEELRTRLQEAYLPIFLTNVFCKQS